MKKLIYISIILASLGFNACNDTLDPEIELTLTEELVMKTYINTQYRATAIYTYLPNGFLYIDGAMMASAGDEAEHTLETSAIQKFNTGAWNAMDNPDYAWGHYYGGIRAANLFLEKSNSVEMDFYKLDPNPGQQEAYRTRLENINRWKYEVRFLRAYFYFELVKRYGGVPLLKEALNPDNEYRNIPRSSLSDCIQFIADECDSAAVVLPAIYDDSDLGRATKGAALALKSRLLLYAASDLFNDPSWAGGYANTELISLTGDRLDKWKAAAGAANEVFKLQEAGYGLADNYAGLFRTYDSPEIILTRRDGASNNFEWENYPIGYEGRSGTTPTQNLVDAYEMVDGSKFDWSNPNHAQDPYANRDPRLGYTILTNGTQFKGRAVEAYTGGRDGKGVQRATRTGYYLYKYIDSDLNLVEGRTSVHSWIIIRLAEVYLNYAEAMNEAYGPDNDNGYGMTAKQALNTVRQRTGVEMPPVTTSDKNELRERIKQERRVELTFEDHRLWDVRRWMEATSVLNQPIKGVDITKRGGTYEYQVIEVENRVFEPKMYFYPIPQKDLNLSKDWPQNPLW